MAGGGKVTIGYRYYLGIQYAICYGPADSLVEIQVGGLQAWAGNQTANGTIQIDAPELFGGEKREGGIEGEFHLKLGTSSQTAEPYLEEKIGQSLPAYRGIVTATFNGMVSALTPYIKPWAFRIKRITSGWHGGTAWYSAKAAIGNDMNPAHIIYECLTNPAWGMGYASTMLDGNNFAAAADTLYAEGFGLSLLWNQQEQIKNFLQLIMSHIGGVLQVDRKTGLFKIKLLRADYTFNNLPIIDETNSVLESMARSAWGETSNEITVSYTDGNNGKTKIATVQDLANIEIQGMIVNRKLNYPGITSDAIAQRVALRELKSASAALTKIKITTNRLAWDYLPGDVVRVKWGTIGIDAAYRIVAIDWGTLQKGEISIDLVEDIFWLPSSSYTQQQGSGWVQPGNAPAPAPQKYFTETPYYDLARLLSEPDFATVTSTTCYLDVYATRPSSDALDFDLWTGFGSELVERASGIHPTTAENVSALIAEEQSVILLTDSLDSEIPGDSTPWQYAIINGEYMWITAYDNIAKTITVKRGILDTVPKSHSPGSLIYILDDTAAARDGVQYVTSDSVNIKVQTRTMRGELDINSINAEGYNFLGRQAKPYPPGKFRINGAAYPASVNGQISLTWAHRNRLTQTTVPPTYQDANSIGPESKIIASVPTNASYIVKMYQGLSLKGTFNVSVDNYTYPLDDEIAAGGPFNPLRIRLETTLDGKLSHQAHDVSVARVINNIAAMGVSGTTYATSTTTNQTIPAATAVGDLLLAFVMHRSALTTPAGWALVDSQINNTGSYDHTISILSRVAQGGDAGQLLTVTQAASDAIGIHIMTVRHLSGVPCVVKTALTAKSASDGGTGTFAAPVATANSAEQLLIIAMAWDIAGGTTTVTPPSGWRLSTPASATSNRLGVARQLRLNAANTAGNIVISDATPNQMAAISLIVGT